MPGIPRSTGCVTCQKRKKKCDEAKPTCGLCTRLGIKCVGNGVKRWKFMTYEGEDSTNSALSSQPAAAAAKPRMSRVPSNEASSTAAALVHILEIQDVRFDIRALGGTLIGDLPAQLGVSPELDAAVSAVVALYKSRQFKRGDVDALTRYGRALTATRRALEKKTATPVLTMQTMLMMYACQSMIDRKNSDRHRIMVAHVFRDTVMRGNVHLIDPGYVHGLCQIAAWASLVDPSFKLGDWFWKIHANVTNPRPAYYQPGYTFHSLATDTVAAAAEYLREPENNLVQLRGIYNLVQSEKPRIRQLAAIATAAARGPTISAKAVRLQVSMLFTWGTILGFGSIINKVLRGFTDDANLVIDACATYDEALDLASQCPQFRPFGAGFLPDTLKAIWAGTSDLMGGAEIEEILNDFESDVEGADYVGDAMRVKRRLELLGARRKKGDSCEGSTNDTQDGHWTDITEEDSHACVVM